MDLAQTIIDESISRLKESHHKIVAALAILDESSIWWKPNENSNSIGNILLHLCGNLTQYILSGIGGLPDHRNRTEEFIHHTPIAKEELVQKLEAIMDSVYAVIDQCDDAELLKLRGVQCYQMTDVGILIHVTEHLSYHTGQIVYFAKWKTGRSMNFYDDERLKGKSGI